MIVSTSVQTFCIRFRQALALRDEMQTQAREVAEVQAQIAEELAKQEGLA
jgi:hypothetical protein